MALRKKQALIKCMQTTMITDHLELHYQPIVDMRSGEWVGAEALLRCCYDDFNISPEEVIAESMRLGISQMITRWICKKAAQDYSAIAKSFNGYLAINITAKDISDKTFPEFAERNFRSHDIKPNKIIFEITETFKLERDAPTQIEKLRRAGFRIALDDFGTGHSNLCYLESIVVDVIKIDKSFIGNDKSANPDSMIWHIIKLIQGLNICIIIEGVERAMQKEYILSAGVYFCQGWLYSKPLTVEQFRTATNIQLDMLKYNLY